MPVSSNLLTFHRLALCVNSRGWHVHLATLRSVKLGLEGRYGSSMLLVTTLNHVRYGS
jgi:hypothetical protein